MPEEAVKLTKKTKKKLRKDKKKCKKSKDNQSHEVRKQYDLGTKIRIERGEIELTIDHEGGQLARIRHASYLDELKNRLLITETQHAAGEKLYQDWFHGVFTRDGTPTQRYTPRGSKTEFRVIDYTDYQMQCWESYHAAIKRLEGLGQHFVRGVCCYNQSLAEIEKNLYLPRQFGRTRLMEALDTLAAYYGI